MLRALLVLLYAHAVSSFAPASTQLPSSRARSALRLTPEAVDSVSWLPHLAHDGAFASTVDLAVATTGERLNALGKGKLAGAQVGFCLFVVPYCIAFVVPKRRAHAPLAGIKAEHNVSHRYAFARSSGAASDVDRPPTGVSASRAKR